MKMIRALFTVLLLAGLLTGCKKDDGTTPSPTTGNSQAELLVANNWQVTSTTTPDGTVINPSRLNLVNQNLPQLRFQFRTDNSVRALDPSQSNKVVNGGSWYMGADNKSIDVDVTGFKGNFPIIRLDRSKLILRQRAPVDGQTTDINLEFEPAL